MVWKEGLEFTRQRKRLEVRASKTEELHELGQGCMRTKAQDVRKQCFLKISLECRS
jgi:hypothetical protein